MQNKEKDVIQLLDHFTYGRLIRFVIPSIAMMIFTATDKTKTGEYNVRPLCLFTENIICSRGELRSPTEKNIYHR